MGKRKICVFSGSRAEFGILSNLMCKIRNDKDFILQIVVTNMHLSPLYGNTYKEIESYGFIIDKKIDILKFDNSNLGIAQSTGLGVQEFSKVLAELDPDIVLILGDRYEMLAVATSCLLMKKPIAHISGGDITLGAIDDAIRHSITKMSHLHFTSTEEYRNRVIQLGEEPDRVFNVGALNVDNIRNIKLLSRDEFEKSIDFKLSPPTFLVTYHPATLDHIPSKEAMENLLIALDCFPYSKIIFTKPNSDADSSIISEMIDKYVINNNGRCISFDSLGHIRYLSALQYVDAVIGNSSSGVVEVPSFNIPTVNIGNRQKGRIVAKSVLNCDSTVEDIRKSIEKALSFNENRLVVTNTNPYEKTNTADAIVEKLKNADLKEITIKKFYDLC